MSVTKIADRFAIESLAGKGGMGAVYRALDERTGRAVAVKVMHAGSDAQDMERFAREAELLAELAHPGIVTYVAHGATEAGQPFLAMEWLDGEDLARRLARGPMSLAEALLLLRRAAEALAAAHARGVVHRDLKPGNLFLRGGEIERVTLVDFGIAKRTASAMTGSGVIVGTPAYMAPEQARGSRQITAAVDVFALGCVLFECLTGQTPFVADHVMAVLARILFDEPTPLRAARPDASAAVEALLGRMLAKAPEERVADAAGLLAALGSLDELRPSQAGASARRGGEQHLLSALLVARPAGMDAAPESIVETGAFQDISELRAALAQQGARLETLADGSLGAAVPHTGGVAADHAAQAARCALLIKARWPGAAIALCTGRGLGSARAAAGEAFDRAAALLRDLRGAQDPPPIVLDEVTAGLLEVRFVVHRASSGGFTLSGEEVALDAARPLLGRPTPCVGREVELSLLQSAFAAVAADAEPRAVLITAPAGAGKSRVRHEFLRRTGALDDPPLVLFGRADPSGAGSSYGLVGHALRRLCGIRGGEGLEERRAKVAERTGARLPRSERRRVAAFLGEVCGAPLDDDADVRLRAARHDPQIMSDQITLAALDLLRAECGERPVVLVLEDLHWGDAPSVRLVDAALRRLEASALMVLALARPSIEEVFPRLWSGVAQVIALRPLGKKAGERLAQEVLGAEVGAETISRVVAQSEGNALLLEELIRAAAEGRRDEAPGTVLAMLQARIERLPVEARRALRAASVFGRRAPLGGLLALIGPARSELDRGMDALLKEEILEAQGDGGTGEPAMRFRHALMRDAAYGLLGDDDRAAWHLRAGEYLEARGEPDASLLAEHFLQGRDVARALRHYVRAAEQSYEANDPPAVFAAAERGLSCGAEGEQKGILLSFLIDRSLWGERYEEALQMSLEALGLLTEGSRRWCWTLQYLFAAASYLRRTELSRQLMARFADVVPAPDALSEYARAAVWLVSSLAAEGRKDDARVFLDRARRIGASLPRNDVVTWAHVRSAEAVEHNTLEEAPWSLVRCNADARDALRAAGEVRTQMILGASYGSALLRLGDSAGAEAELRQILARAEGLNEALPVAFAKAHLAQVLSRSSQPEASAEAEELIEEVLATRNASLGLIVRGARAELRRRRGELAAAEEEARGLCEALSPFPGNGFESTALLSQIVLEQGRAEEALPIAEHGVELLERLGLAGRGELSVRLARVEALLALGRAEEARAALSDLGPRLEKRLRDIPQGPDRQRYLRRVPVNARIVDLMKEQLGLSINP